MGSPNCPPAVAYSDTPWREAVEATVPKTGAWPTLTTMGQGNPRAQYFSRINRPCLPGSMNTVSVRWSWTWTR